MDSKSVRFKLENPEDERRKQAEKMREKNPDKIPIICEKHAKSKLENLDKNK